MAVKISFVHSGESCKLFKAIISHKKEFSFNLFSRLLREKDIKVNGVRVAKNENVCNGDIVEIFLPALKTEKTVDIIFDDANIVVANKPDGIEVVRDDGEDFLHMVSKSVGNSLLAVHRLDRNTTGLVVFAKNKLAYNELTKAFKERTIRKFYIAKVYGFMEKKKADLIAYLRKDEIEKRSVISLNPKPGFFKIETRYVELSRCEKSKDNPIRNSLIEVELVTGKMHQIRAHLAFLGHPIVGDGKYADNLANQKMRVKKQMLCAYKIVFDFNNSKKLHYLAQKTIEIKPNFV